MHSPWLASETARRSRWLERGGEWSEMIDPGHVGLVGPDEELGFYPKCGGKP